MISHRFTYYLESGSARETDAADLEEPTDGDVSSSLNSSTDTLNGADLEEPTDPEV